MRSSRKVKFESDIEQLLIALNEKTNEKNFDRMVELKKRAKQIKDIYEKIIQIEDADYEADVIRDKKIRALENIKKELEAIAKLIVITPKNIKNLNNAIDEYDKIESIGVTISRVKWYVTLSEYVSYVGTAAKVVVLIWIMIKVSLAQAILIAGTVFPPLIYVAIAIRGLFDTSSKVYFQRATSQAFKEGLKKNQQDELIVSPRVTSGWRTFASGVAAVFNILATTIFIIALLGIVLPNIPAIFVTAAAAWVLVAAAEAAGWVSDCYIPKKLMEENCKNLTSQMEKLDTDILKARADLGKEVNEDKRKILGEKIHSLEEKRAGLKIELKEAKQNLLNKSTESKWGLRGVMAIVLIACTPIPIVGPILGIIGYVLLAVVGIRSSVPVAKKMMGSSSKPTGSQTEESTPTERNPSNQPEFKRDLSSGAVATKMLQAREPAVERPVEAVIDAKQAQGSSLSVSVSPRSFLDEKKGLEDPDRKAARTPTILKGAPLSSPKKVGGRAGGG